MEKRFNGGSADAAFLSYHSVADISHCEYAHFENSLCHGAFTAGIGFVADLC
jgi:hypothetical protein